MFFFSLEGFTIVFEKKKVFFLKIFFLDLTITFFLIFFFKKILFYHKKKQSWAELEIKLNIVFKVDIYAAGVVLFILIAGFPPFARPSTIDWWFKKLKEKNYDRFWTAHERNVYFSEEAKTLIQGMLAFDPTERCDTL